MADSMAGTRGNDLFFNLQSHQISSREFFNEDLLSFLNANSRFADAFILYFSVEGAFLSLRDEDGLSLAGPQNPYSGFHANDVVRHAIHRDAIRDRLDYFNTSPRLYKSTDIIAPVDYDASAYVRFLEEYYHAHYSVTMAFGINAYILVTFYQSVEAGDFTADDIEYLEQLYVYISSAYKTFKKYEQARIVSEIQGDIMASGERAFLITDEAMRALGYNKLAEDYLEDLLGPMVVDQLEGDGSCMWLSLLLDRSGSGALAERTIKDYVFKTHTYKRDYSNGIVDRYHWITIAKVSDMVDAPAPKKQGKPAPNLSLLTRSEQRVAELMYQGLTYQEIADELVISFHTVKKHVQNIYSKCGVKSRYQLYKWIEDNGA